VAWKNRKKKSVNRFDIGLSARFLIILLKSPLTEHVLVWQVWHCVAQPFSLQSICQKLDGTLKDLFAHAAERANNVNAKGVRYLIILTI
jgi:hypothetical protein